MSRLGTLLLKRGMITPDQMVTAMTDQQQQDGPLAASLVRMGFVREEDLVELLHKEFRFPILDLGTMIPLPQVLQVVPGALARKHKIMPVAKNGSTLTLALLDPTHLVAIDQVKFLSGCDVRMVVARFSAIEKAIQRYYSASQTAYKDVLTKLAVEEADNPAQGIDLKELESASEDAPVVKLVATIIEDAVEKRASDIHIEPYEDGLRVRFRIDGVLHEIMEPPSRLRSAISSRIKVMAQLDIAERRLPQDGAIKIKLGRAEVNFRISVLPTIFGEKIVLRILARESLQLDLHRLGFDANELAIFRKAISQPSGMILVTGPTGSGKTTTLYSTLTTLNASSRNISSAEDPVEMYIRGVNQVKVHDDIGLTFAAALRAFLRQDPDVIMVGEIRDSETIEIAVKAALTGHLMLSTIHTNDAPSTITRLLNMGVEPFLVASSLNLIIAQRLARLICAACKAKADDYPVDALREIGFTDEQLDGTILYRGKGCDECADTGYKGRLGFYEVLPVTEAIRNLVIERASADEIRRQAIVEGMQTLRMAGVAKAREGKTTIEEILRVTTAE